MTLALIGPLGPLELGIILLIVFVIFGAKRLPELGSSLGSGMRNFKTSVTGEETDPEPAQVTPPPEAAPVADPAAVPPIRRSAD